MISARHRAGGKGHGDDDSLGEANSRPSRSSHKWYSGRNLLIFFLLLVLAVQTYLYYASSSAYYRKAEAEEELRVRRNHAFVHPRQIHTDTGGGELVDGLNVLKHMKEAVLKHANLGSNNVTNPSISANAESESAAALAAKVDKEMAGDSKFGQQKDDGSHSATTSTNSTDKDDDDDQGGHSFDESWSAPKRTLPDWLTLNISELREVSSLMNRPLVWPPSVITQDSSQTTIGKGVSQSDLTEVDERVSGGGGTSAVKPLVRSAEVNEFAHGNAARLGGVPVPVPLLSHRPFIKRATPQPPSACPPPLLMPGKDSIVSELEVFTVVTVVWNAHSMTALEELVRSMHYAGLNNHTRLFEFLVYVAVNAELEVANVRSSIVEWWRDAAQRGEEVGEWLDAIARKVRVVRQPLRGDMRRNQQAGQAPSAPATIIEAMRLVRSEFVIFNPVEDPLYLFPQLWNETNVSASSGDDATGVRSDTTSAVELVRHKYEKLLPLRKHVRTVMNIALQTMSNNKIVQDYEPDAPLVIDQADFLASDEVHAFRLQLYPSVRNMPHNAELTSGMDRRITQFLLAVVRDVEELLRLPGGGEGSNRTDSAETVPTATLKPLLEAFPDYYEGKSVVADLPKLQYGTSTAYHCQRAPIYGVGIYVPTFFRSPQANAQRRQLVAATANLAATASAIEGGADGMEDGVKAALLSHSVTSLCEALLTSPVRMEDLRAQATFFAENVCTAWARLTGGQQQKRSGRRRAGGAPEKSPIPSLFSTRVSLCDSACSFDWLTALKNAQLLVDSSKRQRNAFHGEPYSVVTRSPLQTFARMVFTANESEALSYADRFFPFATNVTESLEGLRGAIEHVIAPEKSLMASALAAGGLGSQASSQALHAAARQKQQKGQAVKDTLSLKYVVQDQRHRRNKRKVEGDPEVLCFSSRVCAFTLQPTLYRTDWVVGEVLSRCLRHPAECDNVFGNAVVAADKLHNDPDGVARQMIRKMSHYLSDSGKWGRGEFKVCMTSGLSVHDPSSLLHGRSADPFA